MRIIVIVLACLGLLLSGCEKVDRTYHKSEGGNVHVSTIHEDGSTSARDLAKPAVKDLTDLGLKESDAVSLLANGTVVTSTSSEPTTLGVAILIILFVAIGIISFATGNGLFFLGALIDGACY